MLTRLRGLDFSSAGCTADRPYPFLNLHCSDDLNLRLELLIYTGPMILGIQFTLVRPVRFVMYGPLQLGPANVVQMSDVFYM